MQTRAALWQRMIQSPSPIFKLPRQRNMSKAERNDENRVYRAFLHAQSHATEEELLTPCRTLRVFVGYKAAL